jgi:hypothetical protein
MSVLCPGFVTLDPDPQFRAPSAELYRHDLVDPAEVARQVLRAVRDSSVHVFTQAAAWSEVEERQRALAQDFLRAGLAVDAGSPGPPSATALGDSGD